eukprot:CAMPEP_0115363196 /NCGR_PEP_ID=MMETSP0270-20121206/103103_1 /TAXON_ID=71861 /ORGANISM="Scrippsiella trochoidea, Strain CCMP3099" /LENGTH=140 /DNA_ID=CAMNT_0002785805 /DNA_START=151 /DNA_END=570 /DNA_ORIENTATION=-
MTLQSAQALAGAHAPNPEVALRRSDEELPRIGEKAAEFTQSPAMLTIRRHLPVSTLQIVVFSRQAMSTLSPSSENVAERNHLPRPWKLRTHAPVSEHHSRAIWPGIAVSTSMLSGAKIAVSTCLTSISVCKHLPVSAHQT